MALLQRTCFSWFSTKIILSEQSSTSFSQFELIGFEVDVSTVKPDPMEVVL